MIRIFGYELRRWFVNKGFWGITAIVFAAAWYRLDDRTILGVGGSAPFSVQSFGDYIAGIAPLMCAALLALWCAELTTARGLNALVSAAPISRGRYLSINVCAAIIAWLILESMVTALGIGFLCALFGGDVSVTSLFMTAFVGFLPALFIFIAAGTLLTLVTNKSNA